MKRGKASRQALPAGSAFQRLTGEIVQAFDPGAIVEVGKWIQGPDGRRDMDVAVRGILGGKLFILLIECKDYNPKTTGPVGIEFVDALDSKQKDLATDYAIICSNSGFTKDALSKAKRVGIGMISVIKTGDQRVKAQILEKIYFRKIHLHEWNVSYWRDGSEDLPTTLHALRYNGRSVGTWVQQKVGMILGGLMQSTDGFLEIPLRLITPVLFTSGTRSFVIRRIDISIRAQVAWFSQVVELNASTGIYNYLRGKIRLAPGDQQYEIRGLNLDGGTLLEQPPAQEERGRLGPEGGVLNCLSIHGLTIESASEPPADLDQFVNPDDMRNLVDSRPEST